MIYVLQVTPASEGKVRVRLEQEGLTAYVPRRELIIRKSGGWSKVINILFPGYVFVECEYNPDVYYTVKSVPEVLRWLGKPTPIKSTEEAFMHLMGSSYIRTAVIIAFCASELISICETAGLMGILPQSVQNILDRVIDVLKNKGEKK